MLFSNVLGINWSFLFGNFLALLLCNFTSVFRKQQRIKGKIPTALATLSAFVVVRQTQANGLTHFWLKWHSQYLFKPCGAGRAGGGEGGGAAAVKCKNATDLQSHLQASLPLSPSLPLSLYLPPSLRVVAAALLTTSSVVKCCVEIHANVRQSKAQRAAFSRLYSPSTSLSAAFFCR